MYACDKPKGTLYVVTDDDRVSCGVPNRSDIILKIVNPEDMREVRLPTRVSVADCGSVRSEWSARSG